MKRKAIIVSGGIAGLCAGLMLQQKGLHVELYDNNTEPTVAGAGIIIAPNALRRRLFSSSGRYSFTDSQTITQ